MTSETTAAGRHVVTCDGVQPLEDGSGSEPCGTTCSALAVVVTPDPDELDVERSLADVEQAARSAGWDIVGDRALCPAHAP